MLLWEKVIGRTLTDPGTNDPTCDCLERLLKEDLRLEAYATMTDQEKDREKGFLRNSIRGFIGYLQKTPASK